MKLKRKINKDEFDGLTEVQKTLYVEKDGSYVLDIDDTAFETLKAEKKAKEDELAKYKAEEEQRLKEAEERAEKRAKEKYEKAKSDKDVEAIEKSWQEKYDKLQTKLTETESKHTSYVSKTLIDETVSKIANEISTSPTLLSPHIRSRLSVDFTGEQPKLIVLDDKGERSALTVDELKKSFIDNKDFSAIIKATSASGGAKAGRFEQTSGTQDGQGKRRLGELSDQQLAEYARSKYGSQTEE